MKTPIRAMMDITTLEAVEPSVGGASVGVVASVSCTSPGVSVSVSVGASVGGSVGGFV
eukprot:CAMPEP_0197863530 /NCGR_PEP_ID=MMETSP1438-20131217/41044_1 /TAXON_ID=1461541 /ORGANISM="Pterosperma sp., Strain CCMP1384" /LENGTH=57 /DNA_ID=CAMNT_0043481457 /DNA_START=208 /DNA_END=378 /DNA_ORIENTATION=+